MVYTIEYYSNNTWVPLKRYSNLSKMKAEFLMTISQMRDAKKAESLRMVKA
tara:strand:+ start:492 stop:644 length:153 start_codon:yes stop_codon:yes gene_type:complete